jgi:hypothetical protein
MGAVLRDKVLLGKLEPYLTVRHYYILAVRNGLIDGSSVRSVIGHDHRRVLRSAIKALKSINPQKSPLLRPQGVWDGRLEYAAKFSSSFSRALVNHGIDPSEINFLGNPKLEKYCKLRFLGMDQKSACRESGNPRKVSLDDESIHFLQVKKFPNFKKSNTVLKRWTRGAVKAYSRMKISHGGCIVNKAGLPRKTLLSESADKFGIGNAMVVSKRMAILSQRILRLFIKSLLGREILEFSELTPEEFDQVVQRVSMTDWKFITLGSGVFIRCYWRLRIDESSKWVNTQRTETVDGYLVSSTDLSTDEL